jgi:hypothetical protein
MVSVWVDMLKLHVTASGASLSPQFPEVGFPPAAKLVPTAIKELSTAKSSIIAVLARLILVFFIVFVGFRIIYCP